MNKDTITNILASNPKNKWIKLIKPYIIKETNCKIIINEKSDIDDLPFTLQELKQGKFNIEPGFYTHKVLEGIVYIQDYLSLDDRFKDKNKPYLITEFGNIVDCYYGVNNKGYTYGFESGLYPVYDSEMSHYSNFEQINYIPKEGELLYYIEKLHKQEITPKTLNYEDSIFEYTSGDRPYHKYMRKFKIGDTSKRKILQSFFIDYN